MAFISTYLLKAQRKKIIFLSLQVLDLKMYSGCLVAKFSCHPPIVLISNASASVYINCIS